MLVNVANCIYRFISLYIISVNALNYLSDIPLIIEKKFLFVLKAWKSQVLFPQTNLSVSRFEMYMWKFFQIKQLLHIL